MIVDHRIMRQVEEEEEEEEAAAEVSFF